MYEDKNQDDIDPQADETDLKRGPRILKGIESRG
jgi:hypothetical protein